MRRYVEQLKEKPEHVRHRFALGAAAGITGLVAVVWLVTNAAMGTFALNQVAPSEGTEATDEASSFTGLLGAAGASFDAATEEGEDITVVDGGTTSTMNPPSGHSPDATVIPF